jgi:LuxR family maltose regulon positive regulatory protein
VKSPDRSDHHPILRTKLHRPQVFGDFVHRQRLHERLNHGLQTPLTLVSAPAGYGKSMEVSHWTEAVGTPSAWLSLDGTDSDVFAFTCYLLAAVQTLFPEACPETEALITSPNQPPIPVLGRSLVNELDDIDTSFLLVLDDFHTISPQSDVHDLVAFILEHPPWFARFVIVARRDPPLPLAGLRGGGKVTEIRLQDLRFNEAEIAELLERTSELTVGEGALANLQKQTEGWAVALRLVSLQLRHIEDPEDFLTNLSGGLQQVQDYLIQEVWERRSPQMQHWLLATSILGSFCAELCDAVCSPDDVEEEESDLDGRQFVDALQRTNLFTVLLDEAGTWFRYHHLFQSVLKDQLEFRKSPENIAALHARASRWYEQHGDIERSIRHALAAGDADGAAEIFERHRHAEQDADRWRAVERWLAMLPAEMRRQRPGLLLAQAWVLHDRYQLQQVAPIVQRLESSPFDEAAEPVLLGELNFFQGLLLYSQGKGEASQIHLQEARRLVPRTHPRIAGIIEIYLGLTRQMTGQEEMAIQALWEASQDASSAPGAFLARLFLAQGFIHTVAGDLVPAEQAAQLVENVTKEKGIVYSQLWGHYLQACCRFRAHDLEAALRLFTLVAKKRYVAHTRIAVDSLAGQALGYQALQRPDDAREALKQLLDFSLETQDPQHLSLAQSAQARLSLAQGDLEAAARWAQSFDGGGHSDNFFLWLEIAAITHCRVLVAIGSDDSLEEAAQRLRALRLVNERLHNTCQTIEIVALQAVAYEKQGHTEEAHTMLEDVLALAAPRGLIRPFVELGEPMADLVARSTARDNYAAFAQQILSALHEAPGKAVAAGKSFQGSLELFETLTNREHEVLELLAQRLQNKEIAAELFISTQTVNSHLKSIYQKLDVTNRRQAAARAVEMGILEPR